MTKKKATKGFELASEPTEQMLLEIDSSELQSKPLYKIESGKIYVRKEDVWMIDTTNKEFTIVNVRESQIKIRPEALVLIGEKNG